MKRSLEGAIKKSAKSRKCKPWTQEEDVFLRDLCMEEVKNWKEICKKINKKFAKPKRTAKNCEERWKILNASLGYNEELMILLTFYRGNIEVAIEILKPKFDVHEYINKLISQIPSMVNDIMSSIQLDLLSKLKFLICVDLALNGEEKIYPQIHELKSSSTDWLELVQNLTQEKEKLTKEALHELVQKLVVNMEEEIHQLTESTTNELKDLMHVRKENPAPLGPGQINSHLNPIMRINLYLFTN